MAAHGFLVYPCKFSATHALVQVLERFGESYIVPACLGLPALFLAFYMSSCLLSYFMSWPHRPPPYIPFPEYISLSES